MKKLIIIFTVSFLLYANNYSIDEWYLLDKIDPITDKKEISIFIKKKEYNSLYFNTFIINIDKDSININLYTPSLTFKEHFDDDNKIELIYRLDKNEARITELNKYGESEFYSLSNNQTVNQRNIILLKELLSYNTLAVRAIETIDSAKHTYTYIYDLSKLREILVNVNFDDTILENYEDELYSIIIQKLEEVNNTKENNNVNESEKTNHSKNVYMIEDINYKK